MEFRAEEARNFLFFTQIILQLARTLFLRLEKYSVSFSGKSSIQFWRD